MRSAPWPRWWPFRERLEGSVGGWAWRLWSWLSLPLLLLAYALLTWYLDRELLGVEWRAYLSCLHLVMNALPGWLCIVLLAALIRRALVPAMVVTALHVVVLHVSRLKLSLLREPLAFHDMYFLANFDRSELALFSSYVKHWGLVGVLAAVAVLALGVVWWLERPRSKTRLGAGLAMRLAAVLVSAGLLLAMAAGLKPWSDIYSRQNVRPVAWRAKMAMLRSGLVSSLLQQVMATREFKLHSDPDALAYAMQAAQAADPGLGKPVAAMDGQALPNIVVILSESFMDPRMLNGMDRLQDNIPTVRQLQQAGNGGWMRVPTFGGGTVKTEFEVLTGMPVAAFPGIDFPYFTLAARQRIPALPAVLDKYGYRSVAIHGNSARFWNRRAVFQTMKFQEFKAIGAFDAAHGIRDGAWYSDKSMTDLILDEVRADKGPAFVFAISMESHGPYSSKAPVNAPERRQSIALPEAVSSPEAQFELRNYLYHQGNADGQLARLLAELGKQPRPYVVLFFGDHLPALGAAYEEAGFVNGEPPQQQLVPWVIARDPRLPPQALPMVAASWQLPTALLQAAGLEGDDYLRLSADVMRLMNDAGDSVVARKLQDGLYSAANQHLEKGLEHVGR